MPADLPEPWRAFLIAIDELLTSERDAGPPLELHCVGGFVVAVLYNLQRSTADIDVVEVVPSAALRPLLATAGRDSDLARKHGVYIDAGGRVATLPENYADRLTELFPATFTNIRLFAVDVYDLALSKLERNIDRDREDVLLLARTHAFDLSTLRQRYLSELRPFVAGPVSRHDLTLELWAEMIEEVRKNRPASA
jgi:hypothetical protein